MQEKPAELDRAIMPSRAQSVPSEGLTPCAARIAAERPETWSDVRRTAGARRSIRAYNWRRELRTSTDGCFRTNAIAVVITGSKTDAESELWSSNA
jgi:hypothetical protein